MTDTTVFTSTSPRFDLPFLFAGQSQKEVTVNEALLRSDILLHPVVEGTVSSPPASPSVGQCWIVGSSAADAFAGRESAIAGWTEGGWRMIAPRRGMRVYDIAHGGFRLFTDTWTNTMAPGVPTGGTTIDVQARATLNSLIELLKTAGVLTTS